MKEDSLVKINHKVLEDLSTLDNVFDINENVIEAQQLFNEYFDIKSFNQTKNFESNIWSFTELINGQTYYFNFESFQPLLKFNSNLVVNECILALKCWIILHLDSKSPSVTYKLFSNLYSICRLTKGFQTNYENLIQLINSGKVYSRKTLEVMTM